jgi:hypothetical protein
MIAWKYVKTTYPFEECWVSPILEEGIPYNFGNPVYAPIEDEY